MIAGAMVGWRNPARYIAPLALAAAVTATYLVVHHALVDKHSSTSSTVQTTSTIVTRHGHSGSRGSKARFYVIKPGDSLSEIADKTGVAIATIEALNPKVNPNALQPLQRLRLRR
jgi:LysM repeat protein